MLGWDLGIVEGVDGEVYPRLGPGDALSLTRASLASAGPAAHRPVRNSAQPQCARLLALRGYGFV